MKNQPAAAGGDAAPAEQQGLRNLQRGVGEVCLLMAGHQRYGSLFLGDIHRSVVPAVLLGQYRIVRSRQERTVGFVSWARVDRQVHRRLMQGVLKLQPQDWQGGDMAVVMDIVAATEEAGARMLREIKRQHFAEQELWVVDSGAGRHEPALRLYALPPDGENPQ